MKQPLVIELQSLAASNSTPIDELLRKALLVAVKLSLPEFKAWINCELNGYGDTEVPEYRKARAQMKLRNPYRGLVPCVIPQTNLADSLLNVHLRDPIGNFVHLLERDGKDGDGSMLYPLPDSVAAQLMEWQGFAPLPPVRILSSGQLAVVVDAVRTRILDWSLDLEAKGILGVGMQFTMEEKTRASQMGSINIENFQGILGNVDNKSHVTQSFGDQIRIRNVDDVRRVLTEKQVSNEDISELELALSTDPIPSDTKSFGPKTKTWMSKMLGKSIDGTWNVGIEVAGNLISSVIGAYYGIGQ